VFEQFEPVCVTERLGDLGKTTENLLFRTKG
jgi:hypothetical protein